MTTTRVLDRQVMAGARIALKVQHILETRATDIDVITQMAATNVPTSDVKVTESCILIISSFGSLHCPNYGPLVVTMEIG